MSLRQPEGLQLDQLATASVDDLWPAAPALMGAIDRKQLALAHGYGSPPTCQTVDWAATASAQTYLLAVRVPPGCGEVRLGVLGSGTGTVAVTSTHDATGTDLYVDAAEVSVEAARWSWTQTVPAALGAAAPALVVTPSGRALWEWSTVQTTWTLTASASKTVRVHSVMIEPVMLPRDSDLSDAAPWAATASIDLDGTADYVDLGAAPGDAYLYAAGITVLAWVLTDSTAAERAIWSISHASDARRVATTASSVVRLLARDSGGTNVRTLGKTSGLSAGAWTHLGWATRFDATTGAKIWVNGGSQTPTTDTLTATDLTAGLTGGLIGAQLDSGSAADFWDGHVLEVAVFAGLLSDDQVTEAYNGGVPRDVRRTSAAHRLMDYFVASANYTSGGVLYFLNLGLRPTWSIGTAVSFTATSNDVP